MENWRETLGNSHKSRLIALLENGFGCPYDVTFLVGETKEKIKAHQLVLRLHSPVFESLFEKTNSNPNATYSIEEGDMKDFKQLLHFLYTGDEPKPQQAATLLKHAVQFKIQDLEQWCWKTLQQITVQSAVTTYELAIKYQNDKLRDTTLNFILNNANIILDSEEFLNFTGHNLFKVLASDSLAATNETQVFNAVLRWGKEMCKRDGVEPTANALRNVLTDLIPMIRFPVMNKSDFSILVAPLDLLTDKELISVLLYFNVDPSKRDDIPPGMFNAKERWFKSGAQSLSKVTSNRGYIRTVGRPQDASV